jgi:hypothetical protein
MRILSWFKLRQKVCFHYCRVKPNKTAKLNCFIRSRHRNKTTVVRARERLLSLAGCSDFNKREVSDQFICCDKLWRTWCSIETSATYTADDSRWGMNRAKGSKATCYGKGEPGHHLGLQKCCWKFRSLTITFRVNKYNLKFAKGFPNFSLVITNYFRLTLS